MFDRTNDATPAHDANITDEALESVAGGLTMLGGGDVRNTKAGPGDFGGCIPPIIRLPDIGDVRTTKADPGVIGPA